jgi:predicted membrane protein
MEKNENEIKQFERGRTPRIWSGLILLSAGTLLLAYKMGAPIPSWLFTWPMILIAVGILTGAKSRFRNPGSYILITIGLIFLIDQTNPGLNFHNYMLPLILIAVGLIYILRPKNSFLASYESRRRKQNGDSNYVNPPNTEIRADYSGSGGEESSEYVEINAVLSGVKKNILSKNFKGGAITSFMGGTELNLLKADIQKTIILEVNNIFGGTKLIVPSNWDVKNEVTAVFGGIEDKRNINANLPDPGKVIILKGSCVFGGIEVTNY